MARSTGSALSRSLAWVDCALGLSMAIALVLLRDTELAALPLAVVGVFTAVAVVTGTLRNRPAVSAPWVMFALACMAFMTGSLLRQVLLGQPLVFLADIASMSGYALMLGAFLALLRTGHSGGRPVHELIDGAIVLVAASALAIDRLTVPTLDLMGLSVNSLVQGAYPVVDAFIVFVVILLSWTTAKRVPAFWLLALAVSFLLVGDIGYAQLLTHGKTVGAPAFDLAFIVAFTALGSAALHPSMRSLSSIRRIELPAWSRGRLLVLVPMLVLPMAVVLGGGRMSALIGSVAGATVTLLVLLRAAAAVHDHARAEEVLVFRATHDPLTSLVNRNRLVQSVDEMLERCALDEGHVDLLFLDLDSFKLVNDTWGHSVGDRVLRTAAARLCAAARPGDVVARIGGDEFAVARYVPRPGHATGEELATQVVTAFREALPGESSLVTTVSVGLASSREGHRENLDSGPVSAESLLRDADTAMYRAKGGGRDRWMAFDPAMHESVRHRVEMELALRYALERDELRLHYQPVVSMVTGEVVGAEALLRWAHPRLGLVSPLDFIPVAEETGLIVEIGEWVVSEALRQAALWRDLRSGLGLPDLWVAVNVSGRQLRDPSLVEHVRTELARFDVPAEMLVMEITETAMMADEDVAADLLLQLRALGLSLAVDDFGTGYSSLGYLRRFPVSKVKVDRAFVARIEHDSADAEIVRAVVAMSLAMRLDVVAEGVETEGQWHMLRDLGVQLGQGWHFGRPVPAGDCDFVLPRAQVLP
jgi:diguanylate cyclase (GGDEF)-like protein